MTSSSMSRVFAILRYNFLVCVLILATLYTHSREALFHTWIFAVFAITLLTAAYAAWRYNVHLEKLLIKVLIVYILAVLSANLLLFTKTSYSYVLAFMIIEFDALIFFIHRHLKINNIIKYHKLLSSGEKGWCRACQESSNF